MEQAAEPLHADALADLDRRMRSIEHSEKSVTSASVIVSTIAALIATAVAAGLVWLVRRFLTNKPKASTP